MKVAIYTRLSDDQAGRSTGIERQIESCRQYAAARDWEVVAEFRDADLSAFRAGVVRPEYEDMLSRLGEFDAVVVWKLDRLVRRFLEFARLWPMFSSHGVALVSATEPIDTSSAIGRIIVLMLVGFAELESETISLRSRAKHDELRRLGRRSGGGPRPFGHSANWREVIPSEAAWIREAAERITAGESVYGIVKDWDAQGRRTGNGKRWNAKTLRDILLQERLVGSRNGVGGQIAPILRRAEWDSVRSVLHSRPRGAGVTSRKYLLSGFVYCAACDIRMKAHRHAAGLRYRCPECYTSIMAAPVETMLVEGVLTLIENTDMPEDDDAGADMLTAIGEDEQALADLSRARYVERSITEGEFRAARDELVTRVEQAKRRYLSRAPQAEYDRKEVRSLWGKADLLWRRQVFGSVVDRVTVRKATRLGRFFDPARVEVSWQS